MFARFRRLRRSRVKSRRSRRGRRTAKQVASYTAVATAVVLPVVLILYSASVHAASDNPQTAVASTMLVPTGGDTSASGSESAANATSDDDSLAGETGGNSSAEGSESSNTAHSGGSSNYGTADAVSSTSEEWGLAETDNGSDPTGESTGGSGTALAPASSGGSLDRFVLTEQDSAGSQSASSTAGDATTSDSGASQEETPVAASSQTASSFSQLSAKVTRIEEDWELNVSQPDAAIAAPQVGTVMTPLQSADDFYLAFVINHRFNPTYESGGMELQLWYQGEQLGWVSMGERVFQTSNERVRWTQRLELEGGRLRFSVVEGRSSTWGSFGHGQSAHLSVATTLTDLNGYRPNVSADNSGVTFAANRVKSLVLTTVRGYSSSGELVAQDTNPVVVFAPESSD